MSIGLLVDSIFCEEDMGRSPSIALGNLGTSKNYVLSVRLG